MFKIITDCERNPNIREGMTLKVEGYEFNTDTQVYELIVSECKTYDDL